jgi:hypothetical protein
VVALWHRMSSVLTYGSGLLGDASLDCGLLQWWRIGKLIRQGAG